MKSLQDILTESLLDDGDEIMAKVESKYNFTNLITNLAFTYSNVAKYEELGNMISKVLSEYKVNPSELKNPKDGEAFFLKFNRLIWPDGHGGRIGVPGSKPFNCGVLISGSEMKLRVSRPKNRVAFETGYIFDRGDEEHMGFVETLEKMKEVEIYRIPEASRKDIIIALTFGKWPKYEKL
jgi:hypothetical protein